MFYSNFNCIVCLNVPIWSEYCVALCGEIRVKFPKRALESKMGLGSMVRYSVTLLLKEPLSDECLYIYMWYA